MSGGRGYLLAVGCLLMSFASALDAQQLPTTIPRGFVPKHQQIQRLRDSSLLSNTSRPAPHARQSSQVTSWNEASTAAYQQPLADHLIVVDDATASTQPWDSSVIEPLPEDVEPFIASACDAACGPVFWFGADYLGWSTREANSPALATTSIAGTAREAAGVLGEPDVTTLFGGDGVHGDLRSGVRFTLGGWFSAQQTSGIQISYITLSEDEERFTGNSDNFPILARPFYNTRLYEEDARLISLPDLVRGDLRIRSSSEFDSFEAMYLKPVADTCGATRLMLGYRQANLNELLRIDETTVSLESPTLDSTFQLFDQFDVDNTFHGYQLGMQHVGQLGTCWSYDLTSKAAMGFTRSRLRIAGQTITTTPNGDVSTAQEGLLALSTNSGRQSDDELSSLFELGVNLRRHFCNGLQFKVGYSYLHWSSVLRAVDHVDRDITPTEIPPDTRTGPARPRARLEHHGYWAQGFNVGLEYQF